MVCERPPRPRFLTSLDSLGHPSLLTRRGIVADIVTLCAKASGALSFSVCEPCKRTQVLQQLLYRVPWGSPARCRRCDTERGQEACFRPWECHVPGPPL